MDIINKEFKSQLDRGLEAAKKKGYKNMTYLVDLYWSKEYYQKIYDTYKKHGKQPLIGVAEGFVKSMEGLPNR